MSYLVSKKHERAIHTMRIFYTFSWILKNLALSLQCIYYAKTPKRYFTYEITF